MILKRKVRNEGNMVGIGKLNGWEWKEPTGCSKEVWIVCIELSFFFFF